jgi:hypothetical protein
MLNVCPIVGFLEWVDGHLADPVARHHLDWWIISWVWHRSGRSNEETRDDWSRRYRFPFSLGHSFRRGRKVGEKPLWQFGNLGIYVLAG